MRRLWVAVSAREEERPSPLTAAREGGESDHISCHGSAWLCSFAATPREEEGAATESVKPEGRRGFQRNSCAASSGEEERRMPQNPILREEE
jgi:hypothetical protein